jgi:hypothetical protein
MYGTDDMVVDEQMVEPHFLDREADLAHGDRVALQFDLGINGANLHHSLRPSSFQRKLEAGTTFASSAIERQ